MRRFVVFTAVLAFIQAGLSGQAAASHENEALAAFQDFIGAISAEDAATATAFYDRAPGFHWVENGGLVYADAEAAATSLASVIDLGADLTVTLGDHYVVALGSDAALISAYVVLDAAYPDPQENFSYDGWMTFAMIKRAEGWRIAGGQTGPGPAASTESQ